MQTFECSAEHDLQTERFDMPAVLKVRGIITPGPAPAEGHSARIFSLGLHRAEKSYPKHWLLIEMIVRNGNLRVASHGFGGKKTGHAPQIEFGKVGTDPIPFALEYSGKTADLGVGGQEIDFTTELSAGVGEPLFLHFGMQSGFDLLPPLGWKVEYELDKG